MRAMRRLVIALALALLLPCMLAHAQTERPKLMYFYENYCQSCQPEQDFVDDFYQLTGQTMEGYDCAFYNISHAYNRERLDQVIEQYDLPPEQRRLPLLILNGKAYSGTAGIQTNLPKDALSWDDASQESVVYDLYVSACESCARAAAVMDALPAEVNITRGNHSFVSPVRVERIDIGKQTSLALALFDAYKVPDDKRVAPIAFVRNRYFAGIDAIESGLAEAVAGGEALGNAIRVADGQAPLPPARLGSAALAGLVGGLNPCALSMLLLFVSLLLPMGRRAGLCAAAFLGSKFVAYLLIGTLLTAALQAWNPSWLALALKLLLSVYCVALLALNLWDAWNARKQRYGQIKNQLPSRMRGWIQRRIKAAMDNPARLIPAVLALGALVAASEFLCAGQVYLATLLSGLRSGWGNLPALVIYCAAFVAPSALVAVAVLRGKAVFEVSGWLRERMPTIKLVTALFFAMVLAYIWMA